MSVPKYWAEDTPRGLVIDAVVVIKTYISNLLRTWRF